MEHKFRTWIGPSQVDAFAEIMRQAELRVLIVGTEHITFTSQGFDEDDARGATYSALIDAVGGVLCRGIAWESTYSGVISPRELDLVEGDDVVVEAAIEFYSKQWRTR
jgi:hypothetical protein